MKKFILLVLCVFLLVSCDSFFDSLALTDVSAYDPDFEISYNFKTVDEAWRYVSYNIRPMSDRDAHGISEYWQYPWETYELGTGDCEDYVLLFMHLLNRMGYNPKFAGIRISSGLHAVVLLNGKLYEPQQYGMYYPATTTIELTYDYSVVFGQIYYNR